MPKKPAKPAKSDRSTKTANSAKPARSTKTANSARATKTANSAKPAKPAKPADKPAVSRKRATRRRTPSHNEIAERAYFIHLEEGGCDELGNWLRAEDELTTA